ncbi:MAG TPA: transglycosylase SLT domain-containing protein [Actinocrinis sp.]
MAVPVVASAATGPATAATHATAAKQQIVAALQAASATQAPQQAVLTSDTQSASTYTVKSGDTLFGIAASKLGSGDLYPEIFKLNSGNTESDGQTFTDANLIMPGWTLTLPSAGSDSDSDSTSSSSGSGSASTTSSSSSSSSGSSSASNASNSSDSSSSSSSSYGDDLSGWINEAISVLAQNGYSVSYNAVYVTAMAESGGDPNAVNDWDSNAANGDASTGLMQVIPTTFDAYALAGYGDINNPVDNIIAAARYAAAVYGSLDNVVSARCDGSCWYGY